MAKQVSLRKGTTAQNDAFTGAVGELTVDTEQQALRLHDGATAGGRLHLPVLQTLAKMQEMNPSDGAVVWRSGRLESGDHGPALFRFSSADGSAEVGADEVTPAQGDGGIYVAPASDRTGATGFWIYQPETFGVIPLALYGGTETSTAAASNAALDAVLASCWRDYTRRFTLLLPSVLALNKNGDFNIPPNLSILGCDAVTKLKISHANTRLYMKRDNSRVAVEFRDDGEYWGLGSNKLSHLEFIADGVVVEECIFISSLIYTVLHKLIIEDRTNIKVGVHFQNADSKWTEYWGFEFCRIDCKVAGIKFSQHPTSPGTASAGHGRVVDSKISARAAGASGVLVTDNISPYHMSFETRGFVDCPDALLDAALIRLQDTATLRLANFRSTIETLDNTGPTYVVKNEGTGTVVRNGGKITAISQDIRFKGVDESNTIQVVGGRTVLADGLTKPFLGHEYNKFVSPQVDANGDNLLIPAELKAIQYSVATVAANAVIGHLPRSIGRATLYSVEIIAGTAGSGNTGAKWSFGLRKKGSTNPTVVFELPDGDTTSFTVPWYLLPTAWRETVGNEIIARSLDGTGNDGTAPATVTLILRFFE